MQWIDALRGAALVVMIVNHTVSLFPALHGALRSHAYEALGFFSMAEVFLFLAGVSAALAYKRDPARPRRTRKVLGRVAVIYGAHMLMVVWTATLVSIHPGIFGSASRSLAEAPATAAARGALFLYQPFYLDILPLYIGALLLVPLLTRLAQRRSAHWALVASLGCWAWAQTRPQIPDADRFLSWAILPGLDFVGFQSLFIFAFLLTETDVPSALPSVHRVMVVHARSLRWTTLACAVVFFVLRHALSESTFAAHPFLFGKEHFGVARLASFTAFALAFKTWLPWLERIHFPEWLMTVGRSSLFVFTAHVVAVYTAKATFLRDVDFMTAPAGIVQVVECAAFIAFQMSFPWLRARARGAFSFRRKQRLGT